MPGRLVLYEDSNFKEEAKKIFPHFKDEIGELTSNYNIAPTQNLTALLNNGKYSYVHFGMIPSWSKNKKNMNINARSETLCEKKSFKDAFIQKRCLVVVNGFYEWKEQEKLKVPYLIKPKQNTFFALAGLYDEWYDNVSKQTILSVALITTRPNELIEKIHDRMPVILDKKDWKTWLGSTSLLELNNLLLPCSNEVMDSYKVNPIVNKISNNTKECIEPSLIKSYVQESLF